MSVKHTKNIKIDKVLDKVGNLLSVKRNNRNKHRRYSKEKIVFKNFANSQGRISCQRLFSAAFNFIKKDSGTGVLLRILRNI